MKHNNIFGDFIKRAAVMLSALFVIAATAWAQTEPRVGIELCEAGPDYIHVKGWACDPDNKDYSIDVAVYIEDALPMKLMLISGGTGAEAPYGFHDWNFILSEMGLLLKYDTIANAVYAAGYVGMWLCVLWGGWSLFYYWFYQRNVD